MDKTHHIDYIHQMNETQFDGIYNHDEMLSMWWKWPFHLDEITFMNSVTLMTFITTKVRLLDDIYYNDEIHQIDDLPRLIKSIRLMTFIKWMKVSWVKFYQFDENDYSFFRKPYSRIPQFWWHLSQLWFFSLMKLIKLMKLIRLMKLTIAMKLIIFMTFIRWIKSAWWNL